MYDPVDYTPRLTEDQHRTNSICRYPEGYKPSANGNFFRNAKGLRIHNSTFNSIRGDMIIYPEEQPSLVCKIQSVIAQN
jgi:hypothetical protein